MAYGAFGEWGVVPARHALPVPAVAPEVVALLTSGLTASIGAVPRFCGTMPAACIAKLYRQ